MQSTLSVKNFISCGAHARTHARTHSCMHTRTHACTHSCMYSCTHACTHAHRHALEKCPHKPFIYMWYLDDIFIATIHEHSIDFLDTTIYKDPKYQNSLLTKVYFKPTDIHQLLDKTSFHPKHTFSGILKSQITKFYRICSEPSKFETAWSILYIWSFIKKKLLQKMDAKNKIQNRFEIKIQNFRHGIN